MKITNNHSLPAAIVAAVSKGIRTITRDTISATQLIDAPMIRELRLRHATEIEEDASERLWALLGQGVHAVLEMGAGLNHLAEQDLRVDLGVITLTGVSDLYDGETQFVEDWKCTSVYAFLLGEKVEWENQLNVYAYMYRRAGFPVNGLRINAFLRDWNRNEAARNPEYPQCGMYVKEIPLWSEAVQEKYILDRITLHLATEPVPCTPSEMWERPTTYAVKKRGNKRATRVCDSIGEAQSICATLGPAYEIEERKGIRVRCENFCNVSRFCEAHASYVAAQGGEDE